MGLTHKVLVTRRTRRREIGESAAKTQIAACILTNLRSQATTTDRASSTGTTARGDAPAPKVRRNLRGQRLGREIGEARPGARYQYLRYDSSQAPADGRRRRASEAVQDVARFAACFEPFLAPRLAFLLLFLYFVLRAAVAQEIEVFEKSAGLSLEGGGLISV